MTILTKQSGIWKDSSPQVKDASVWKPIKEGYVKDAGTWKLFHQSSTLWTVTPTNGAQGMTDGFGSEGGSTLPAYPDENNGYTLSRCTIWFYTDSFDWEAAVSLLFSTSPGSMVGKSVKVNGDTVVCNQADGFTWFSSSSLGYQSYPFLICGYKRTAPNPDNYAKTYNPFTVELLG